MPRRATETAGAPAESGSYADGDYSGEGSYINPGGSTSSVEVDLTLAGRQSSRRSQVEPQASGTSMQYQKKFVSGVADEVVGKSIDELNVSKVAGSSLTSQGFNAGDRADQGRSAGLTCRPGSSRRSAPPGRSTPASRSPRTSGRRCWRGSSSSTGPGRGFAPTRSSRAIADAAGEWTLPEEAAALLGFYDELHDATDGAVNPLIGRTLADLGYDADYSLRPVADPAPVPDWASVQFADPVLRTTAPVLIDVGAAGKGLLVDLVAALVGRARPTSCTVDASGDLLHRGAAPIRVALEHPSDPGSRGRVSSSWARSVRWPPRRPTGAPGAMGCTTCWTRAPDGPPGDVVATWVVADSCMRADGLATAHFLAPADALVARWAHEFVRMYADGRIEWSPGLPGEVFV